MTPPVAPGEIVETLLARFQGIFAIRVWGETSLFYTPGQALPRGVYFATVKQKDGENDRASRLDRDGFFRFRALSAQYEPRERRNFVSGSGAYRSRMQACGEDCDETLRQKGCAQVEAIQTPNFVTIDNLH